MMRSSCIVVVGIFATGLWPAVVHAVPERLIQATPREAIAALYLEAATRADSKGTAAETLITVLSRSRGMGMFGQLSGTGRMLFDLLQCWPVIHRYPRAYVLHDVRLKQLSSGSNRLDRLAMSLILRVSDDALPLQQLIQHFLRSYTNNETGRLEEVEILGRRFHRLTDASLPDWVVWEWGRVDDLFIVGLGTGSTERILQSLAEANRSMLQDEWFIVAHSKTAGPYADFELYLDVASVQQRLGEGSRDRVYAVVHSLGLEASQRSMWTVGSVGEAYRCSAYHRRDSGDVLELFSDPAAYHLEHKKLIPDGASGHAVLNVDAPDDCG